MRLGCSSLDSPPSCGNPFPTRLSTRNISCKFPRPSWRGNPLRTISYLHILFIAKRSLIPYGTVGLNHPIKSEVCSNTLPRSGLSQMPYVAPSKFISRLHKSICELNQVAGRHNPFRVSHDQCRIFHICHHTRHATYQGLSHHVRRSSTMIESTCRSGAFITAGTSLCRPSSWTR